MRAATHSVAAASRPVIDSGLLEHCEPGTRLRVAVLLSGGVDSSVALALAQAAGHQVEAFYLQIWFQEDFRNTWEACPWERDLEDCRAVCAALGGVPLHVVPLTEQYWDSVAGHCLQQVRAGQTPNPDVMCNTRVKFGAFMEWLAAERGDIDRVASGHYALLQRRALGLSPLLRLSGDSVKDQTYFLSQLRPSQLARCMFPLGHITKSAVRDLASRLGLPTAARRDSQGLCFLGRVPFEEFVRHHLGEWPGILVDDQTGEAMGFHPGFWFFTVGQRKGIRLHGGPWYVTRKDVRRNVVFISRSYHKGSCEDRRLFEIRDMVWHLDPGDVCATGAQTPKGGTCSLQCKVRHGPQMTSAELETLQGGRVRVRLAVPDQGLAPGQFAVFYTESGICCASGVILGSPHE